MPRRYRILLTREAFIKFCEWQGTDSTVEQFEESYRGTYRTLEDYAEEFVNDCYDIEKKMGNLAYYFDYGKFARDLELNGDIYSVDGGDGCFVFDNN